MYNPVSTYRLQFNKEFTLQHADALLPYLQMLGVKTIYASPIFAATPGSTHGYDGIDPTRINPEIGTDQQMKSLNERLRQANMGWLQDIVPNHLAFDLTNEWLMDMLEKGPLSRYAPVFETALASSFFQGPVMVPFLPAPLNETLEKGGIELIFERQQLALKTNGLVFPLNPRSYPSVLQAAVTESNEAIHQLLDQLDQLHHLNDPDAYAIAWNEFRQQLAALIQTNSVGAYLRNCLSTVNEDPDQLRSIVNEQHYRLCDEPESRQTMNYRRFFAINGLICLSMQDEAVFQLYHGLTKKWLDEGLIQGVRIDHIDGLLDPTHYLERLRTLTGPDAYIVVEKILQADEDLPIEWALDPFGVAGTTGYDFLAMVNNLLTDGRNEMTFRAYYQAITETDTPLPTRIMYRKAYFLAQFMGGEVNNLYHYFLNLDLADEAALADLTAGELTLAISELLVQCPVYRFYGNQLPLKTEDAEALQAMIDTVRAAKPELTSALNLLERALLIKPLANDTEYTKRAAHFYQRLMQFTGPLMAKGVEDTLLYTYTLFVGHNEVGDSPERFGMSPNAFHQLMQDRQTRWPLAQNTTSTHDTKRGEDVRARLNVLTDLADEWLAEVQEWQRIVQPESTVAEPDTTIPDVVTLDRNDAYFIYQNLLGAYPMPGQDEDDFPNRFRDYLEKSLKEAKRHTVGWDIEEGYFEEILALTERLLDRQGPFWTRFEGFHRQVSDFGIVNSLAQVVLKFTCPGVPDLYRGCEGWDLSLVDPDNRRPVNFVHWSQALNTLLTRQQTGDTMIWADLWQHRWDGRIKLWLTHALLHERQQNTNLFATGDYLPLAVEGTYREHIVAFARRHEATTYVIIVPLHSARLCRQQKKDTLRLDWQDTRVLLPPNAPTTWTNCLLGTTGDAVNSLSVQRIFRQLPVALLRFL